MPRATLGKVKASARSCARPDAVIASAGERISSGISPSTCTSACSRPVGAASSASWASSTNVARSGCGLSCASRGTVTTPAGVVSSSRTSRIETRSGNGNGSAGRRAASSDPAAARSRPSRRRPPWSMRPRSCEPLDAHRLDTATQEVARPIIDGQPADPLLRARPAAEREARQLEPVQADPKAIEGNFLVRPPCAARRAATRPAATPAGRRAARAAG